MIEYNFPVRATTPNEFDKTKHKVTKFKRKGFDNFHTLDDDGLYTHKGDSADYHYSEGALLALSDVEVIEYKLICE